MFGLAGFAAGAETRETLIALVAAHLETLRGQGVAAVLADVSRVRQERR